MEYNIIIYRFQCFPKENLLNFAENLKGAGPVTLAPFVLAEKRSSGGFSFWPKQKPRRIGRGSRGRRVWEGEVGWRTAPSTMARRLV
jgi:hypothetical protein